MGVCVGAAHAIFHLQYNGFGYYSEDTAICGSDVASARVAASVSSAELFAHVYCVAERRKPALLRYLAPQTATARLNKIACACLSFVVLWSLARGVPSIFAAAAVAPRDNRRCSVLTGATKDVARAAFCERINFEYVLVHEVMRRLNIKVITAELGQARICRKLCTPRRRVCIRSDFKQVLSLIRFENCENIEGNFTAAVLASFRFCDAC